MLRTLNTCLYGVNLSYLKYVNSDFTVKVNNTPLERVIKHTSLGVQLDESLNWRPHTNTISKKNICWS